MYLLNGKPVGAKRFRPSIHSHWIRPSIHGLRILHTMIPKKSPHMGETTKLPFGAPGRKRQNCRLTHRGESISPLHEFINTMGHLIFAPVSMRIEFRTSRTGEMLSPRYPWALNFLIAVSYRSRDTSKLPFDAPGRIRQYCRLIPRGIEFPTPRRGEMLSPRYPCALNYLIAVSYRSRDTSKLPFNAPGRIRQYCHLIPRGESISPLHGFINIMGHLFQFSPRYPHAGIFAPAIRHTKKPPQNLKWFTWRRSGSNRRPLECHSSALAN